MKKLVIFCLTICVSLFCFTGCNKNVNIANKNLSCYEIVATLDYENKTLAATEKITYVNKTKTELNEVCFHLYPNAFRQNSKTNVVSSLNKSRCYENGESFGNIEIKSCKQSGENVNYQIGGVDENILTVSLNKPLLNKKSANIEIEFVVQIPNCNHRLGWNEKTINLGNFYPIACVFENGAFVKDPYNCNGDPFYSECANYKVSLTAPQNLIVAGTGNKTQSKNESQTITKFSAKAVRDFAIVLGEFEVKKAKVGNVIISYYYYDDQDPSLSLETAKKSIKTFGKKFGKYPYKTFDVVQTKFVQGGMEFPGIVLISDSLSSNEEYQMVIIHETAHQWFYSLVGNNQFENAWQDEALAEFSTAYFYKLHPEYNVNFEKIYKNQKNSYLVFEKVYKEVLIDLETSISRRLDEFNTEPEYTYLTYVKGNLMFKNLFDIIGEKKFVKALKTYCNKYSFKTATPQNLIDCFSKASGKNQTEFFNNWLSGNVNVSEI